MKNSIKLGLVVPPIEYIELAKTGFKNVYNQILGVRTVKFLSPQFKGFETKFEIVDVVIQAEACTAIIDEAISEENNKFVLNPAIKKELVYICIDIGGGTTDLCAVQGTKFLVGTEKTEYYGVNDTLGEIGELIKQRYGLKTDIPISLVNQTIRYKNNILPNGIEDINISEIVEETFQKVTDKVIDILSKYKDNILKKRGISDTQLAGVLLVGGGAEMYGDILKDKVQQFLGNKKTVIKTEQSIWRTNNGLSKLVVYSDKQQNTQNNFNNYVFLDIGNSSTKAKICDLDGKKLSRVELLTQIATPAPRSIIDLDLEPVKPTSDLELEIINTSNSGNKGFGKYAVSKLANTGLDKKSRINSTINKTEDNLFYTMIYSSIAVLLRNVGVDNGR